MKEKEPAFYAQVQRGIVLWEATSLLAKSASVVRNEGSR